MKNLSTKLLWALVIIAAVIALFGLEHSINLLVSRAYGGEWNPSKHQEFVIKDSRGVRVGKVVTDHVRGGYKIQDQWGVTKGRIKSDNDFLTSDRYDLRIERRK